MSRYSIGLDLGGTNLRAAAIDESGKVLERTAGSTNLSEGRDALMDDMTAAVLRLRDSQGISTLAGVGIAIPGFILMKEGVVTGNPNLPGFENFPVRDEMQQRLGIPFILENDANAAALGEKWMGAGKDVDDLAILTLGTGIGGGVIVDGKVLHGFVGMGGELGHMTVNPTGNPCGCGNRGCLEKHASATAVVSMARLLALGQNLTAEDVYHMAMAGNEHAKTCFRVMGQSLGIALANLVNIFNFPLYLLSGGMLGAWDLFAPPMFEEIAGRSFTYRATKPRIEKAVLGNEAGMFGAACLSFLK